MNDFQGYFDKTLKFVSLRPRSEAEVAGYLLRKKIPPEIAVKITNKLTSLGFVNDEEFASWWVEQRKTFRPKGIHALKSELRAKGLSTEVIEKALEGVDELPLALQAAQKKNLDRERLIGYLGRKGFSWATIRAVLEKKEKKE